MKKQLFSMLALVTLPATVALAQGSNSETNIQNSPLEPSSDICWNVNAVNSNDYSVHSDLSVFNNGQKYIYRGANSELWVTQNENGSFYSAPISTSYKVVGDISAVQDGNLIFFVSQEGIAVYDHDQSYTVLQSTNPISALVASNDGLNIYYQQGGQIWQAQRNNVSSSEWVTTKIAPEGIGTKILINPQNSQSIFFRAQGDQLFNAKKTTGGWTVNPIADGLKVSDNFAISQMGNEIFLTTTSNELMRLAENTSGSWDFDYFLANYDAHNDDMDVVDNIASDIQIADNPRKIFYIGADNNVWNLYHMGVWRTSSLNCKVSDASQGLLLNESRGGGISYVSESGKIVTENWGVREDPNPDCSEIENSNETTIGENNHSIAGSTESIIVYPNPVNDRVHVVSTSVEPISEIQVYNAFGQLIETVKYTENHEVELDMTGLTPGSYLLRINSSGTLSTKPVTKK